uniref:Uncharacterized protein n=1 Tax=Gasterosteus aculeatus TaxID=69293 RepID=G3PH70_GASAC
MDQITVVRIDDTHIAQEQFHNGGRGKAAAACYEMEFFRAPRGGEEAVGEEEVRRRTAAAFTSSSIQTPEEDGESYQFSMSVDPARSPARKPALKHPARRGRHCSFARQAVPEAEAEEEAEGPRGGGGGGEEAAAGGGAAGEQQVRAGARGGLHWEPGLGWAPAGVHAVPPARPLL